MVSPRRQTPSDGEPLTRCQSRCAARARLSGTSRRASRAAPHERSSAADPSMDGPGFPGLPLRTSARTEGGPEPPQAAVMNEVVVSTVEKVHVMRQMRAEKANASKPGVQLVSGTSPAGACIPGRSASGAEVTRARFRLLSGTWEALAANVPARC